MAKEQEPVRILLADGQSLFREAVRLVLETQSDLQVVAEAGDLGEALDQAERHLPDVALIDLNLGGDEGVRATAGIVERVEACRVLVLTDREDPVTLIRALESGATGYLTKNVPLSQLIHAVRAIHAGETLVPPRMLGPLLHQLIHRRRDHQEALQRTSRLTRREREVLALLADGADNEAISRALVISTETARTHVQNVLTKLGVHSRLEAAAFVMRSGILEALGVRVEG